jgi:uncharacterized repeat protein (TIGR01451 family)
MNLLSSHMARWRAAITLSLMTLGLVMCVFGGGFLPATARADLRSPTWWDPNAVGSAPDWHYRVPIEIPAGAAEQCTIRLDVDFAQLLASLGASGAMDGNSPRVIGPSGAVVAVQQYTDTVYQDLTDAAGNGRGEIRFLLEDNGPATYYLYFDLLANGAKPAWDVNNTINGNFEFLDGDRENPPGWEVDRTTGYQAQVIDNEASRTVTDADGVPASVSTSEDARTGQRCYLMGARDVVEPSGGSAVRSAYLRRRIDLPATNRGQLRVRFRVKGWDSSDSGANRFDFLRIQIRRNNNTNNDNQVIQELVGPNGAPYEVLPYSPNQGLEEGSSGSPGYGIYNGGSSGNPYALPEQWYEAVYNLADTNRQRVMLFIETNNYYRYKSWFHIDDVEWSVVEAGLGSPEPFGVNITVPAAATVYAYGNTLSIQAQVDAGPAVVQANLYNPVGTMIAGNIPLFNDGTHGDGTAGDAFWSNNGSLSAEGTYIFLPTDMPGTAWQVVVTAWDTQIGVSDAQLFTLFTPPNIMLLKTVITVADPVNGTTNPKASPGAYMEYTIVANNQGGTGTDGNTVFITDPIPAGSALFVGNLGQPSGPVAFVDGGVPSGLSFDPVDDLRFSNNTGATFDLTVGDLSADAGGCDGSITHLRVNPKGVFAAAANGNVPQFTLRFRVRVQ